MHGYYRARLAGLLCVLLAHMRTRWSVPSCKKARCVSYIAYHAAICLRCME